MGERDVPRDKRDGRRQRTVAATPVCARITVTIGGERRHGSTASSLQTTDAPTPSSDSINPTCASGAGKAEKIFSHQGGAHAPNQTHKPLKPGTSQNITQKAFKMRQRFFLASCAQMPAPAEEVAVEVTPHSSRNVVVPCIMPSI
ncbi:hypothetical protein [Roseiflexus castenholzii]|uniref:hypothetical protein n=1 Tax=Roseiflexus castenholzii TaxID=120962 RepID=UPI0012EDD853|nr:hypothetical protein [Roseiflexus castenholzii]